MALLFVKTSITLVGMMIALLSFALMVPYDRHARYRDACLLLWYVIIVCPLFVFLLPIFLE